MDESPLIRCSKCHVPKHRWDFGRQKGRKEGLRSQCKVCARQTRQNYVEKFPERVLASKTRHAQNNHARIRELARARDRANPDKVKARNLRKRGLSVSEFNGLLEKQSGLCAICRSDTPRAKGRFRVDHDHRTQEIRGLLCHPCNVALGLMRDDVDVLLRAALYLKRAL